MGHCEGPVSTLRSQNRTSFASDQKKDSMCIHMHCPLIHVHVAGYSYTCHHLSHRVRKYIHMVMHLWVHGCMSMCRILFGTMGQSREFGYLLWTTEQNLVICYGPQCSVIDHNAESHELNFKACIRSHAVKITLAGLIPMNLHWLMLTNSVQKLSQTLPRC